MTATDDRDDLLEQIETRRGRLATYAQHWQGVQPASYLSPDSRKALDNRIARLGVNFPRLVVQSITERLQIAGWRRAGEPDPGLETQWRRLELDPLADLVHTDRLLYGTAAVTVWATGTRAVVTADSPMNVYCDVSPVDGSVTRAVRTWSHRSDRRPDRNKTVALVFDMDAVRRWEAPTADTPAAAGGWSLVQTVPNSFDMVPVVPFTRRMNISDPDGTSAVADILDLTDANSKVLGDAMVTSEYYARPRRWATGLEIMEDDDGNIVDPFGDNRFLQNEAAEGKFGQLPAADVTGYGDLISTLTQQIGALTGLPPHYLGLHGDQPANADSVRAAEAQLTSRARGEIRQLSRPWATVQALAESAETGRPTDPADLAPRWDSPEIRTPGQAADAAAKLRQIGIPLDVVMADTLRMAPADIRRSQQAARREALDAAGADLAAALPNTRATT